MLLVALIIWSTFSNDADHLVTSCFVSHTTVCMIFEALSKCNSVTHMCRDDGKDEEICHPMPFAYFWAEGSGCFGSFCPWLICSLAATWRARYCNFASWCRVSVHQEPVQPRGLVPQVGLKRFSAHLCHLRLSTFLPSLRNCYCLYFSCSKHCFCTVRRAPLLAVFLFNDNHGSSTWSGRKLFLSWVCLLILQLSLLGHLGMYSAVAEVVWVTWTLGNSSFLVTLVTKRHYEEN